MLGGYLAVFPFISSPHSSLIYPFFLCILILFLFLLIPLDLISQLIVVKSVFSISHLIANLPNT